MHHDIAAAIYADFRLCSDSRRTGRLLLGALRRDQPRSGGHHGARRAGRRTRHEVHARRLSLRYDSRHRARQRPARRAVFRAAGRGLHQLQGGSNHRRHGAEHARRCRRDGHRQGNQHRRQSGRRLLHHPICERKEGLPCEHRRLRVQLVHADRAHRARHRLRHAVQDQVRSASDGLRRAPPGGGLRRHQRLQNALGRRFNLRRARRSRRHLLHSRGRLRMEV